MEVMVSVLDSKNLSQSNLITRSLISTLQVGSATHKGSHVETEDVRFTALSAETPLIVTLTNCQTQTVMYVRNVPLNLVSKSQSTVACWVALYAPGDPRNLTFEDEGPPRPDAPQIHVRLQNVSDVSPIIHSRSPEEIEADRLRSTFEKLEEELADERHKAIVEAARPSVEATPLAGRSSTGLGRSSTGAGSLSAERASILERENVIIAAKADDIKTKVAAMVTQKTQVQSAERQLQDVLRDIDEMRQRLSSAEDELQQMTSRRGEMEREKQDARENWTRLQDTLRNRELSIVEMRNSRDEADRRLSTALEEASRIRAGAATAEQIQENESQDMVTELGRWQSEADELEEKLRRSNQRMNELQEQEQRVRDAGDAAVAGGAEQRALRQQLDEAAQELAAARQQAAEQAKQLAEVEDNCRRCNERLGVSEAAAEEARQESRQRSAELRAEADAVGRELAARSARVAQLEGSVDENRKQLRELQQMADGLAKQGRRQDEVAGELEGTISGLLSRLQAAQDDIDSTQRGGAEVEAKTAVVRSEADSCRRRAVEVEASKREAAEQQRRSVDELNATRRSVESELRGAATQAAELGDERGRLDREATRAQVEADARELALQETCRLESAVQRELEDAGAERARREQERREVAGKLAELEQELEEARRGLRGADEEAARLRAKIEAEQGQNKWREQALQEQLTQLNSELAANREEAKLVDDKREAVANSLEESRRLLPEKRTQAKVLGSAESALQESQQRIRAAMRETQHGIEQQEAALQALKAKIAESQSEAKAAALDATSSEMQKAELLKTIDANKAHLAERQEASRSLIGEVQSRRTDADDELGRLRGELARLASEQAQLSAAKSEASKQLEGLREADDGEGDIVEKLRSAEADHASYEAREAEMSKDIVELERRLEDLEAEAEREFGDVGALEATQMVQRNKLSAVRDQLSESKDLLATTASARTLKAAGQDELRRRASAAEQRVQELRAQLASAQAAAERVEELRSECSAASEALHGRREESSRVLSERDDELEQTRGQLRRTASYSLDETNAELDRRMESIDLLEREVMSLYGRVEELGGVPATPRKGLEATPREFQGSVPQQLGTTNLRAELLSQLEAAEAAGRVAADEVAEREAAFDSLKEHLAQLEGRCTQLEASSAEAAERLRQAEAAVKSEEREAGDLFEELKTLERGADKVPWQRRKADEVSGEVAEQEKRNAAVAQEAEEAADVVQAAEEELDAARQRLQDIRRERDELAGTLQEAQRELEDLPPPPEPSEEDRAAAAAAEEQMIRLLKEQVKGRREALERMQADEHEVKVLKEDMQVEMLQMQDQMQDLRDKLAYQVEHGNLQFSTIEKLEADIRTLEDESSLLTLGLHEAEQLSDALQKENYLMRQQVEGHYEGSFRDWAEEVQSVKVAAEIQRHKDELSHWRGVAEDAEREFRGDISAAQQAQEDTEAALRTKVEGLSQELPAWIEKRDASLGQEKERKVVGNVHSAPAALHGLIGLAREIPGDLRRRALVVGCNYAKSHAPLQGGTNDAWNMLSTLRQSFQYKEDQVRCLIDGSATCPTPAQRQPTRANIMESLKWLTSNAREGDNLLFYFGGYGTQLPVADSPGLYEAHLVPCDFAKDLPKDFFARDEAAIASSPPFGSYRTVPLAEISNIIHGLPARCKITVLLDCAHSVIPQVGTDGSDASTFKKVQLEPPLPGRRPHAGEPKSPPASESRPQRPSGAADARARRFSAASSQDTSRPRALELPPLEMAQTPMAAAGAPACLCHCFAACEAQQWCSELQLEGCQQGAFTWAFVKALTVGHLDIAVRMHSKALRKILADLQQHFKWLEQLPVIQLSPTATLQDPVLLP